jgi:NAD(P)H-hydrate epimerase
MIPLISAEQMRSIDETTIKDMSFPSLLLMERAGLGVARLVSDILFEMDEVGHPPVSVLCGKGNNGGDGLVVARHLIEDGFPVSVGILGDEDELTPDARTNLHNLRIHTDDIHFVDDKDKLSEVIKSGYLVVDALLGTGAKPGLRGLYKDASEILLEENSLVVSLDAPSGLDVGIGEWGENAIYADFTITLALPKVGLIMPNSADIVGELFLQRLGYPQQAIDEVNADIYLLEDSDFEGLLPERGLHEHKGDFGKVLVIAGSRGMVGAGVMASVSALRAGAGLVKLAIPESIEPQARSQLVEVMTIPVSEEKGVFHRDLFPELKEHLNWADVVVFGPGVSTEESVRFFLQDLLRNDIPMIIDADGLNLLSQIQPDRLNSRTILTPHPGELARLMDVSVEDIQMDRVGFAKKASEKYGCVVVLKGCGTVINSPDNYAFVSPAGGPELASGGSGDILTGIIAGMQGQFGDPLTASLVGVYLHGLCGDILSMDVDERYIVATDLLDVMPIAYDLMKYPEHQRPEHLLDPFPYPIWGRLAKHYRIEGEWSYF